MGDIKCVCNKTSAISLCQGVFEVLDDGRGLLLTEIADGVAIEDISTATGTRFEVCDATHNVLYVMSLVTSVVLLFSTAITKPFVYVPYVVRIHFDESSSI